METSASSDKSIINTHIFWIRQELASLICINVMRPFPGDLISYDKRILQERALTTRAPVFLGLLPTAQLHFYDDIHELYEENKTCMAYERTEVKASRGSM